MPITVECPHCAAKLRLLRPAAPHAPILCSVCNTTFFQQPAPTVPAVGTVPVAEPPRRATPAPAVAPPRPALGAVADGAAPAADAPPALSSPPPPPAPTVSARPGLPQRLEVRVDLNERLRGRVLEPLLGASLFLLVVVALVSGGFLLYRLAGFGGAAPKAEPPADAAEAEPGTAPDAAAAAPPPRARELPRPADLGGVWESRADDGSHSSYDFRADGTALVRPAGDGRPGRPILARWFVTDRRGDDYDIEFGPEFDVPNNHRFTFRVSGRDAFTLLRTTHRGVTHADVLRFVRRKAPADPPP